LWLSVTMKWNMLKLWLLVSSQQHNNLWLVPTKKKLKLSQDSD
jgi:hypothetical protein